jgi:hypothetical protein
LVITLLHAYPCAATTKGPGSGWHKEPSGSIEWRRSGLVTDKGHAIGVSGLPLLLELLRFLRYFDV